MKTYLPTFEECQEIVATNDAFYETKTVVDGFNVSIFNYRLADYNDFICPLTSKPHIQAFELRGITFIQNGDEWQRLLMLHKFFNLNQVAGYQLSEVSRHSIVRVQDKLDGSMIRFVRFPNGKIYAKTKMGFDNDQSKMAQFIFDTSPNIQAFVQESLDNGLAAIFEIVSFKNQIVLFYKETALILTQIRNESDGSYFDIYNHNLVKKHEIKTAVREDDILSWDQYLSLTQNKSGIEGWILTLSNGQMIKLKTAWYCSRHNILMENLVRENLILELVLNETLDDALSLVDENDIRRKYSISINKAVSHWFSEKTKEVLSLVKEFTGDRKTWAQKNIKHPFFPVAASCLGKNDLHDQIFKLLKEKLRKDVYRLEEARSWLKDNGVNLEDIPDEALDG